jgi:ribonucleoside-diphosphate reductase alpha chain
MQRKEVIDTATAYFKGNELQANVWVDKYCLQDKEGNYLESTPDEMFHRLAKEFARIEQNYLNPMLEDEIYQLLRDFRLVIPGGSILFGCGNDFSATSLGNCFVIGDATDSYGSICKIDEEQVQLMKRRGGVGHDLSHLRPSGSRVNNAAGTSTGAVSFMHRYSNSTREVAQGGRRGALMLTMDVNHKG